QALTFNRINNVFADAGAPIDVDIETNAAPAAVVDNAQVKARVIQLLDDAKTNLLAASPTFPFKLSAGFVGFDTPADFLKFNRALRARMSVYSGDYAGALAALNESFLDLNASLRLGTYDTYSASSGDLANPLYDPTCRQLFSIPQNKTEAQTQS